MSAEKTKPVTKKRVRKPVTKTSDKREELMKRAEEATKKQFSEFDLHQAKKEAFEAGFEAAEELNDIAENVAEDLMKWTKRQAIRGIVLDVTFAIVALSIVVMVFLQVHGWAMNLK